MKISGSHGASEIFRKFDLTELYYKIQSNEQSLNVPYNSIKTSVIHFFFKFKFFNIFLACQEANIHFNPFKLRIISNF